MNIPGLLIEYIITGAISFIWIFLLLFNLTSLFDIFKDNSAILTIMLIPFAYLIGMVIDIIVYPLVRKLKRKIKTSEIENLKQIYPDLDNKMELEKIIDVEHFTDKLIIDLHLNDKKNVVDEINWRSSRDRIARGMILNSLLIGLAITFSCQITNVSSHWLYSIMGIISSLVVTLFFVIIWKRFEKLSLRFQVLVKIKMLD